MVTVEKAGRGPLVPALVLVLMLSACRGSASETADGSSVSPTVLPTGGATAEPTRTPAPYGLTDEVELGPSPWGIVYAFGSLWTVGRDAVYRLDPATTEVVTTIPLPEGLAGGITFREGGSGLALHAIAAGDGAVWVAHSASALTLVRIDAVGESVTGIAPLGEDAGIASITTGFGSVWVANFNGSTVTRVDARTLATVSVIGTDDGQGGGPSGIGAAAGSIWVANHRGNDVIRIEPATNAEVARIPLDISVGRLAAADDGVWVVSAGEAGIVRIDPASGRAMRAEGTCPRIQSVTVGSRYVWVTRDGGLCRVDRSSMAVESVRIDLEVWGVAEAGDAVWVTSQASGVLARIAQADPG